MSSVVYRNENYGYMVMVPPSVNIRRSAPPNPDHGFEVTSNVASKVWVDASYTDSATTSEEASRQTDGCHTHEMLPAILGGKDAIQLRFSCPSTPNESAYTQFLVLTVQKRGDRSPAMYEVGVRADSNSLPTRDIEIARRLVAGFSFAK